MEKLQLPPAEHELAPRNGRGAYPVYAEPGYGYSSLDESQSGGGLLEYWRILRCHKNTLILITFLGALAGVLLTLPQTPVYQARTALEIQDLNENFLNIKQINPVTEGNGDPALADIQTQIKLLQSELLIKRVLVKLDDHVSGTPRVETSRIAAWRKALNLPEPKASDELDVHEAARNLRVRAAGQTRIVEVLYDSTDPRFAAAFVNTLAQEFIDSNIEARWKASEHIGEWLSRQLDEMRIKLERSEDALQSYARSTGLMFTSEKTNVSEEKLRQLQEELSKAQADRITSQSRWEITKTSSPDALPDVLNDSSLRSLQEKLTELRRQQAELTTIYTEKHSKVKQVEAQIAPLEAALQKERSAVVNRLRNDYDAALRREKLLTAGYATQSHLVSDQGDKSIQYNILKREVDSNRQIYEAMLQQVKQASIASAMRASNVRIVDPAEAPKHPYKPSLPLNGALGLLSGLFVGVVFVIMRERADRTLQEPGEAQFWLNVPELCVIPSAAKKSLPYMRKHNKVTSLSLAPQRPSQPTNGKRPAAAKPGLGRNGNGSFCVELVTWQRKPSPIAELFRSLLTSILFSGENGDRPRVLVLTSASPMEGKTTVASNLGIALAEIKRKVLIIDGDLRKPRMHELFDLPNGRGLRSLLYDHPLAADGLEGIVQETSIPGLFVLPSGPPTDSAANLLYSENLPLLLAKFKKDFDMVIIDTPPMLQMPDARIVGRIADAVILVTRAGHTTRDAAVAVNQRFADDRTRVLGTVLNDWDPNKTSHGGYGYGAQYHHYYQGS